MISKPALTVSYKPHRHIGSSVAGIHYNIIAALLPAAILGITLYGMHAARVITLSVSSAMIWEILIQKLFKKPVTVHDGSAALTGLLFALILPASVPFWLIIVGTLMCMLVGKHVFGGLGSNPLNAVLVGWAILRISWGDLININFGMVSYDLAFSIKYPLSVLKKEGAAAIANISNADLLLGRQAGGIGTGAGLLLLLGGLYLILRGIISWKIPLAMLTGIILCAGLFRLTDQAQYASPLFHVLTGNALIGAFFLATDYSSSPSNTWGMIVFGLACGILTVLFRVWSVYPDGVAFAILIMNIATPFLDKIRGKSRGVVIERMDRA
jgi:electron transport complex protein RnfD